MRPVSRACSCASPAWPRAAAEQLVPEQLPDQYDRRRARDLGAVIVEGEHVPVNLGWRTSLRHSRQAYAHAALVRTEPAGAGAQTPERSRIPRPVSNQVGALQPGHAPKRQQLDFGFQRGVKHDGTDAGNVSRQQLEVRDVTGSRQPCAKSRKTLPLQVLPTVTHLPLARWRSRFHRSAGSGLSGYR